MAHDKAIIDILYHSLNTIGGHAIKVAQMARAGRSVSVIINQFVAVSASFKIVSEKQIKELATKEINISIHQLLGTPHLPQQILEELQNYGGKFTTMEIEDLNKLLHRFEAIKKFLI